jgi:hypothetical protein
MAFYFPQKLFLENDRLLKSFCLTLYHARMNTLENLLS